MTQEEAGAVRERAYLIRFGVMSQVGRFTALPACEVPFERGQVVVIQSHRGLELGEILIAHDGDGPASAGGEPKGAPAGPPGAGSSAADQADRPHVVRLAGVDDLARSERALELRPSRYALCQRVLAAEGWPWELLDVEPLLDDRATVLHYLGPSSLDVASLRARFRVECDLDVVLESAGSHLDGAEADEHAEDHGCQSGCGSCDCGAGGGCGSSGRSLGDRGEPSADFGTPSAHANPHRACSSCAVGKLMAARGRKPS
jgi:hypothetical protein